jgi:hypothetical protein
MIDSVSRGITIAAAEESGNGRSRRGNQAMADERKEQDVWSFNKDTDAKWTWRRQSVRGVILMQSLHYFDDLDACQLDAERHGYSVDEPVTDDQLDIPDHPDHNDDHADYCEEGAGQCAEYLAYRERLLHGRPD